jgi:hypothetical protein
VSNLTGTILEARFELRGVLGEGGMGQVYKAHDRELDRFVAVKTLLPQFLSDPVAMEDMKREVRLAQRLSHPNIVAVYDYRVHQRTPYIVMELIEGHSLLEHVFLHAGHRLPEEVFRALAEPIMAGVEYAHMNEVVHRDLKPENIMVTAAGGVKLMDFGIAAVAQANYTRMTGRSSSLSVAYASPEQINGASPVPSMDIYSLGCVFYTMLSGHPPFYQGEILHQQLTREAPAIPDVAAQLNAAVLACLVKDPSRRLRSVSEVRSAIAGNRTTRLARANSGAPAGVGAAHAPQPATPRESRWTRPGREMWLVGFGLLALATGLTWWLTATHGSAPDRPIDPSPYAVESNPVVAAYEGDREFPGEAATEPVGEASPSTDIGGGARRDGRPSESAAAGNHNVVPWDRPADGPRTQRVPRPEAPTAGEAGRASTPSTSGPGPRLEEARPSSGAGTGARYTGVTSEEMAGRVALPAPPPATSSTATTDAATPPVQSAPAETVTPPSALPGTLVFSVTPWGEVFVNGRTIGSTPLRPIQLPAGEHRVRIFHPQFGSVERRVVVSPGSTTKVVANMTREGGR